MVRILTGTRGAAGGGGMYVAPGDARALLQKKKRSSMTDARDMLNTMAKNGDARSKLDVIRNRKAGKADVKKTAKGGITITTTNRGDVVLTTRKKEVSANMRSAPSATARAAIRAAMAPATQRPSQRAALPAGNLTRRVGRGGQISISTKKTGTMIKPGIPPPRSARPTMASRPTVASRAPPPDRHPLDRVYREEPTPQLTRTIRGTMSAAARLDEELLNTHVEPVILKRTIRQAIRDRSPAALRDGVYMRGRPMSPERYYPGSRSAARSRSPMDMEDSYARVHPMARPTGRAAYRDYDRPTAREDEVYRRRLMQEEMEESSSYSAPSRPTMANRLDADISGVSPLAGAKIIVSNLQESVTQEDIVELFGDIGALKRAKLIEPGTAEIVFVNRSDAAKAVEIYHNRQLDGKAMKCRVIGSAGAGPKYGNY